MVVAIAFAFALPAPAKAKPEPLLAETPLPEKIEDWTRSMKNCFGGGQRLSQFLDSLEHEENVDRFAIFVAKSKVEDIRYVTLAMLLVINCMIDMHVHQNFDTHDTIALLLDEYNGLLVENFLELKLLAETADLDRTTKNLLYMAAALVKDIGKVVNEIRLYESMVYGGEDRAY
jgi:hypothetical protein